MTNKILKDENSDSIEGLVSPQRYGYYINLDERGEFFADVRNSNEDSIFEINGLEIFDDGFMKNKNDIKGLQEYLIYLGIINKDDDILTMHEFEEILNESPSY